jgi:hypothetical protein
MDDPFTARLFANKKYAKQALNDLQDPYMVEPEIDLYEIQ